MILALSPMLRRLMPLFLLFLSTQASSSELFPRPKGLEPDIAFWVDIYTKVESDSGVIHDARDLSVRYEILNFSSNTSHRSKNRQTKQRKLHYKNILSTLATGKRQGLTREQQRVLDLWPYNVSNKTLAQAAKRIRFQLGQADRFKAGLIRSGQYKPFIDATFAKRGLPPELAALPHVESSFNPAAYSKVGAAGMWQFTRSTGRRYMRIDHVVDERRDPFLSTDAAASLLENNYGVTGTWPLALTGYNHGVAGMRRASRQQGTTDIETIVRNYKGRTFGFASRNFYVAFLAALHVDQNPEKYFGDLKLHQANDHVLLTTDDYVSADGLAKALNIKLSELKHHNPALQATVWSGNKHIPKGFILRLPAGSLDSDPASFLASLDPSHRFSKQLPDVTHTVRRGDTLSLIATEYGLRVSDMVKLNGLRSRHKIRVGQVLRLPTLGQPVLAKAAPAPAPVTVAAVTQTRSEPAVAIEPAVVDEPTLVDSVIAAVANIDSNLAVSQTALAADPSDYSVGPNSSIEIQAMETLGHYGDWLELKTQRLRDINGYAFRRSVVVGHRLKLDFSEVDQATFEARRIAYHRALQESFFLRYRIKNTHSHTIRRGESLWVLAQREYHVPVWLLRQYNPDLDLDRIHPGMKIQFPVLETISKPIEAKQLADSHTAETLSHE